MCVHNVLACGFSAIPAQIVTVRLMQFVYVGFCLLEQSIGFKL